MVTVTTYLIVCPLVFLAGFVDAVGGGGGLISLPAYIFAGLPMHNALGTNKFSAVFGTSLATGRFIKNKMVEWKMAIPCMITAYLGSTIGAKTTLLVDSGILEKLLLIVLPVSAAIVFNKKLFADHAQTAESITWKMAALAATFALFLGFYDGFYGPGTGTFAIILLTVVVKLDVAHSNGLAKVINLCTNAAALVVFLLNGQVLITLGIVAAICNMIGSYIGSGLVLKKGTQIARPIILVVLLLLFLKILIGW